MPARKLNTIYKLSNSYQYNYFLQTFFGYVEFDRQIQQYLSKWGSYERERERETETETDKDRQTENGGERERVCVRRETNMPPHFFLTDTLISGNSPFVYSVLGRHLPPLLFWYGSLF